jgi:two-component system chemotaxis sensor kinase CheA
MDFDPEFVKQLTETFRVELEEKSQLITDNLLLLDKGNLPAEKQSKAIEEIFRSAHNIKGAARGVGVDDVGQIAHSIESIFSAIQKKSLVLTEKLISLCLKAVDKMRTAMQSYLDKTLLPFSIEDFLAELQSSCGSDTVETETVKKLQPENVQNKPVLEATIEKSQPLSTQKEQTIHVSLDNLDRVSALMEKMQVNKIAIDDYYLELNKLTEKIKRFSQLWKKSLSSLNNRFGHELGESLSQLHDMSDNALTEMSDLSYQLNKNMRVQVNELSILSNSLQDEVRMLRLVPATTLLRSMPRYVRDIAIELGKQVDFEIKGDQVKMDKMVLEALQDPLMHLLRNAIDHGIEAPNVRKGNNKLEIGRISVNVCEEGDHILIVVEDDGAGIDIEKIAKKALEKKIVSPTELNTMSDNDILNYIFHPGLSTKENITQLSGRGVGLDVVKTNIEGLKGSVQVETILGKGTTFYLRVPLTLASERGLTFRCGGQLFVIPTNSIERVMMLETDKIVEVEASQAILLNGHPVYLLLLSDILNLEKIESINPSQVSIIVIKKAGLSVALVVDEIIGEREIVIKPLHPPLHSVTFVSGGTLAGNGQVIIVLNADDIVNVAFHIVNSSRITTKSDESQNIIKPHILVVDDSITTRTLEKNILESKNYQVTTAVDGKEAWEILQKQKFSLLITDVSMPNMDGFALTELVRKSEKLSELPVIIVTSLGSDEEKVKGLKAGANHYIVKSEFESGALLTIVEQLI